MAVSACFKGLLGNRGEIAVEKKLEKKKHAFCFLDFFVLRALLSRFVRSMRKIKKSEIYAFFAFIFGWLRLHENGNACFQADVSPSSESLPFDMTWYLSYLIYLKPSIFWWVSFLHLPACLSHWVSLRIQILAWGASISWLELLSCCMWWFHIHRHPFLVPLVWALPTQRPKSVREKVDEFR